MTYIGRTWLYWWNLTSIGRISLLPAEYDLYWLISLLLAEYAANQKCSALLLCSVDSIYPSRSPIEQASSAFEVCGWTVRSIDKGVTRRVSYLAASDEQRQRWTNIRCTLTDDTTGVSRLLRQTRPRWSGCDWRCSIAKNWLRPWNKQPWSGTSHCLLSQPSCLPCGLYDLPVKLPPSFTYLRDDVKMDFSNNDNPTVLQVIVVWRHCDDFYWTTLQHIDMFFEMVVFWDCETLLL